MIQFIVQWVAPPALGAIAGLSTVFMRAELERWAERRKYRRELIASWRSALAECWPMDHPSIAIERGIGAPICQSSAWASLRPHIPTELLETLEGPKGKAGDSPVKSITSMHMGGNARLRNMVIDAIAAAERKWGLV